MSNTEFSGDPLKRAKYEAEAEAVSEQHYAQIIAPCAQCRRFDRIALIDIAESLRVVAKWCGQVALLIVLMVAFGVIVWHWIPQSVSCATSSSLMLSSPLPARFGCDRMTTPTIAARVTVNLSRRSVDALTATAESLRVVAKWCDYQMNGIA